MASSFIFFGNSRLTNPFDAKKSSEQSNLYWRKIMEDHVEVEKGKTFIIVEIIEYIPNSVVIKTIIRKTTGNVSAVSFDSGESLTHKTSAYDTFIQVIDGKANIIIETESHLLNTGESIIIPANTMHSIKATVRFKMISTIIKSGYED